MSEIELPESYYAEWGYDGEFKDAWGTPLKYVSTPDGKEFTLTSYGADTAKGAGTGEFDADIVFMGTYSDEGFPDNRFVAPPNVVERFNH